MTSRYDLLLSILVVIVCWRVVGAIGRAKRPEPGFKPWTARLCAAVEIVVVMGSAVLVLGTFR